jgi:hypothetical protein
MQRTSKERRARPASPVPIPGHARPPGIRSRARVVALALIASVVLAACLTSSSSTPSTSQVRSSWTTFFKGSTPAATRLALLQDSSAFRAAVQAQSSSAFAKGVSVTVQHVRVTSSNAATVTYTILIGGVPEIPGQVGLAVRIGGHWKVSAQSFCGLLALEKVVPKACASSA